MMRSTSSRIGRRASAVLSTSLVALLALSACGGDDAGAEESSTLKMSNIAGPTSYDPYSSDPGFGAFAPAYDTLLHLDSKGELTPWLAESWDVPEPDQLVLKLRDDVTFTDGTALDAQAVKTNFEYGLALKNASSEQTAFKIIDSIEAVDESTVKFTLKRPNADFAYNMTQRFAQMVSPQVLKEDPKSLGSAPAGSGPYVLDKDGTRSGVSYSWVRNEDYWNADAEKLFPFDSITYSVNTDWNSASNAAKSGQIDLLNLKNGMSVPGFESAAVGAGQSSGVTGMAILDLSGEEEPALKDVRVRQAMNYAIDIEGIIDSVFSGEAEAVSAVPVAKDSPGYSAELDGMYDYDPEKAKALLKEAGFENGFDFNFTVTNQNADYAQAISGNLREVGINAEIGSFNGAQLAQEVKSGKWLGANFNRPLGGDFTTTMNSMYSPQGFYNIHGVEDPKLTSMIDEAADTNDDSKREELQQKAAVYAAEQAWLVGTLNRDSNQVYNPDVVSIDPAPSGQLWLYMIGKPAN